MISALFNHYIFIDSENCNPTATPDFLTPTDSRVYIFVGPNHSSVHLGIAMLAQKLGDMAKFIKLDFSGKNALDFLIAYHVGYIFSEDKRATITIYSNDSGYDSLIEHLQSKKFDIKRREVVSNIKKPKEGSVTIKNEANQSLKSATKYLLGIKNSRPRKLETLSRSLHSHFNKKNPSSDVSLIIDTLLSCKCIDLNDKSVTYNLPMLSKFAASTNSKP